MFRRARFFQRFGAFLMVGLLCVIGPRAAQSAPRRKSRETSGRGVAGRVANYRSKNFLVRTDLSPAKAKELLGRLETMLGHMARYWGRPNRKTIECTVVENLANWPEGSIDPRALPSIRRGAGITMTRVLTSGNRFAAKSIVYAVARRGMPQHEAVHAYCAQTFGTTGPVWYSEGMADVGNYWREKDSRAVHCGKNVVRYIRRSTPKPLAEIVRSRQMTGDSWQNYAWRWALCHLLGSNPNYAPRFQPLGLALLSKKKGVTFQRVYGPMAREISFEYRFFLEHLERGYRVDLCSWDWKAKYRMPRGGGWVTAHLLAARGWQPSRLLVRQGQEYAYSAAGTWKTDADGKPLDADGREDGSGRLMGVIFNKYVLSKPFALGTYGTFKSPTDGKLLLRCRDSWNGIADNSGTIRVRLKVKGRGKPLSKPEPAGSGRSGASIKRSGS